MGPNAGNKALALFGVAIAVAMLLSVPFIFGANVFAPVGSDQSGVHFDATSTAEYQSEMTRIYSAIGDIWKSHCESLLNYPSTQTDENGAVIIDVFQNQCLGNLTADQIQSIFDSWINDANGGVLKLTSLDPYKVGFDGHYMVAERQWVVTKLESGDSWQEKYLLPESFVISGVTDITVTGCENIITPLTGELVIYDCHKTEEN